MKINPFVLAVAISSLPMTAAIAAPAPALALGGPQPAMRVQPAAPVAVPRPVHAVLRYDASAVSACRGFSDTPPEICVLLALHIIHMSQKPFADAAM